MVQMKPEEQHGEDVEGGDDRDRYRSHDQGELPCGYPLIGHAFDLKDSPA